MVWRGVALVCLVTTGTASAATQGGVQPDLVAALFAQSGAYAAIGAAAVAVAGWFGKQLYAFAAAAHDAALKRNEAVLRLFVDVKLTVENAATFKDASYLEAYVGRVRALDSRRNPFRAYTIQVTDETAYASFSALAHRFPPDVVEAFRHFVLRERTSNLQYDGLSSDAFARLETERKVLAIEDFFTEMTAVEAAGRVLLYKLAYHSGDDRLVRELDDMFGRRRSDQGANGADHG
jgi:hypothetical protein